MKINKKSIATTGLLAMAGLTRGMTATPTRSSTTELSVIPTMTSSTPTASMDWSNIAPTGDLKLEKRETYTPSDDKSVVLDEMTKQNQAINNTLSQIKEILGNESSFNSNKTQIPDLLKQITTALENRGLNVDKTNQTITDLEKTIANQDTSTQDAKGQIAGLVTRTIFHLAMEGAKASGGNPYVLGGTAILGALFNGALGGGLASDKGIKAALGVGGTGLTLLKLAKDMFAGRNTQNNPENSIQQV